MRLNSISGRSIIFSQQTFFLCLSILAWNTSQNPIPLVLPVHGKSHLAVQPEGVAFLSSLKGFIAPVVVIGPYRSGKSFTLNQLLGVSCGQGFGVGHTRDTQTKGIWIWGEPQIKETPGGGQVSILYVDTEGFESTGKANSYDDRVFAVSAILSSLLIYNLPETIRESDIEKLSFSVELSQGLYEKYSVEAKSDGPSGSMAVKTSAGSFQPGSMLWLIQRDFLQGKPATEVVAQALAEVPNPSHDSDIEQINQIRRSLSLIASNSTGYSLAQPHLERTRLCELPDSELDPKYLRQRDGLRVLVKDMARPKTIAGRPYLGKELALLLQQLVVALNSQEIPNAASMLKNFNRDLVAKCVRQYRSNIEKWELPMEEDKMDNLEFDEKASAAKLFDSNFVGSNKAFELENDLLEALIREYHVIKMENVAKSNTMCGDIEARCESELDALQTMSLPSIRKFNITFNNCQLDFERACVGPAKPSFAERLQKAYQRAEGQFSKSYNDRLYSGMTFISLGLAILFRLLFHVKLLEGIGWACFVFLEVYPRLYTGTGSMYNAHWWQGLAACWEMLVYVLFGFNAAWILWLLTFALAFAYNAYRRRPTLMRLGKRLKSGSLSLKLRSTRDLDV